MIQALTNAKNNLQRHLQVFMQVWRERKKLDAIKKREGAELEFLPAALEIQETPPSPIGRAIIFTVIIFFLLAILWATFGKIDIVTVAQGKIIPTDRIKLIQPLELGVIKGIHVREGQQVKAGDLLIELDSTNSGADMARLEKELEAATMARLRVNTLMASINADKIKATLVMASVSQSEEHNIQSRLLNQQYSEYRSHFGARKSELEKRRAERAAIEASVIKLQATLPLITQRAESMKKLSDENMVPEHSSLEIEEQRITQQQDLIINQNRLEESDAAIREAEYQLSQFKAEYRGTVLAELAETERQYNAVEKEYIKAKQRNGQQRLTASIDGTVQQLVVHTIGGVVTPAQELMRIVPRDGILEVEAWLENKDIGFVDEGMQAEVKVDAFPFTKYGMIDAEIIDLSNDAIADEVRGLVFAARVLLKSATMQVGNKIVNLSPGMTVAVEVKTGQRRVIEFFLAPLLRYKQESIRER